MNYKPNLKFESTSGSFKKQEQINSLESTQKSDTLQINTKPNFATKPSFNVRNRSIPLQDQEQQLSNTKEEFYKTGSFQEKVPLKDRIQRSDEKKNTAPTNKGLYLPGQEELFKKQIQMEKRDQLQPKQEEIKQEIKQTQKAASQNQLPKNDSQNVKEIKNDTNEMYMPSIGKQNKREAALLGSKNQIDNQLAIADQAKVQSQLEEAEPIEDVELVLCPEGCGRQFKEEALEKHIKICKQVFQQKRQEFNSKQARLVSNEQSKLQRQGQIKEKQQLKKSGKAPLDPSWKKQSEELRNLIKKKNNNNDIQ